LPRKARMNQRASGFGSCSTRGLRWRKVSRATTFTAGLCIGVVAGIYLLTKGQARVYGHDHLEFLEYQNEVLGDE
jgi:hypothetical protein